MSLSNVANVSAHLRMDAWSMTSMPLPPPPPAKTDDDSAAETQSFCLKGDEACQRVVSMPGRRAGGHAIASVDWLQACAVRSRGTSGRGTIGILKTDDSSVAAIDNPLRDLPALSKVHWSWPRCLPGNHCGHTPGTPVLPEAVLQDYVRITHSFPLSINARNGGGGGFPARMLNTLSRGDSYFNQLKK